MADSDAYQNHMDEGHNAAWDHDWPAAIDAYSQAAQILPDDPDAHINLGLALLNDGQLDNALKVYRRAHKLSPDDPIPLERSADALERMGQLKEAAQQYVQVSEIYLAMRDLDKAIGNWERATQLTPGLVSVHARLAQAYERVGDKPQAIREYLILAFNFRNMDEVKKAIRAVERALRLDKNNPQALNTLRALKSGGEVVLPEDMMSRVALPTTDDSAFDIDFSDALPDVGEAHPLGPIGEALDEAIAMLAAHVVESGLSDYVMPAMQAMEYQRQELAEQAIEAYQEADAAGLRHPSLKLCLGGLLMITDQSEDALPHLEEAQSDTVLAAGALHAMGLAFYKLNKHREASRYLIQSLRAVDTGLAVDENEVAELRQVYDNLMIALEGRTAEALTVINERFVGLLSGKNWKQRIAETRRHLDETLRDEGGQGVIDFLSAKGSDDLAELSSSIERFINAGLFTLAMDESHRAIEKSPYYLPAHVRMAEVMMKEGRIRQAIIKYNMVARAYLVRDENDRAASILGEVLEMAPLDIQVRENLIELLETEDRWSEALDQHIELAETYQHLGDFDQSSEAFEAAQQLAIRIEAPSEKLLEIMHFLADISQMRLNTRHALKIYEEILGVDPSDEKALRSLVDIYYTQGNQVEAVKNLDGLLGVYAKSGEINRITRLLEDLVSHNQDDMALRQRLASTYRRLKQVNEAIEQLDALGELQLDAGMHKEAAKTIRQIITMKPDRLDEYKKLLGQLGG